MASYLNFIPALRFSLLWGAKALLSVLGYRSFFRDDYTLLLQSGEGIRMVYSCIGYGVMSFWAAFVTANKGSLKKKAAWTAGGLLVLWLVNVWRIVLILLGEKNRWAVPLGWDHHTWFNVVAYAAVFGMIYFYDRSFPKSRTQIIVKNANQNIQAIL